MRPERAQPPVSRRPNPEPSPKDPTTSVAESPVAVLDRLADEVVARRITLASIAGLAVSA